VTRAEVSTTHEMCSACRASLDPASPKYFEFESALDRFFVDVGAGEHCCIESPTTVAKFRIPEEEPTAGSEEGVGPYALQVSDHFGLELGIAVDVRHTKIESN